MYCRQHGYPTAPLISYKITGIGRLWGFSVPLSELSTFLAQRPNLWDLVRVKRNRSDAFRFLVCLS